MNDKPRPPPNQETRTRLFVACPHSGSPLLTRVFAKSLACAVTIRLILIDDSGSREVFSPDYSMLENPCHHSVFVIAVKSGKRFLICKEEFGNKTQKDECPYDLEKCGMDGRTEPNRLLFQHDPDASSSSFTCRLVPLYERLIRDPQTEVERICTRWGAPFSEMMLYFKEPFESSIIISTDGERTIYCEEKPLGLFTTVDASSFVDTDVPYHDLLSNTKKDNIEEHLARLYIRCWQDDVLRLRAILAEKTWVGFDLDDTLHEFRRSSGTATNKILEEISQRYGTPMPALKDAYSKVLKAKTANAFSDGKSSFDYRRERFASVLTHFSLPQDERFMAELLDSYEATLMASLELKCGALGLLSAVRNLGKKIVVLTEGPQDAQERTVQGLGIGGYVDFLATTNHFRVSKTSGLFPRVLEHLGLSPGDMVYVGDNEQRDMKPAMAEGIFSVHLAETEHVSLNTFLPQINTLRKLQYIFSNDGP